MMYSLCASSINMKHINIYYKTRDVEEDLLLRKKCSRIALKVLTQRNITSPTEFALTAHDLMLVNLLVDDLKSIVTTLPFFMSKTVTYLE